MPTLENLRPRAGEPITVDWGNGIVTWIENSLNAGAVTYEGYVQRDIKPALDGVFNLGNPSLKFANVFTNSVNADLGYFANNAFVQGKRVLKDGDPIYVADLFAPAESKIVDALLSASERIRLGMALDKYAYPFTDVFANDLIVERDGTVVVKFMARQSELVYLAHKPYGATQRISALLFDSALNANTWYEKEFTVNKGDAVNVFVSKAGKCTVIVYNVALR